MILQSKIRVLEAQHLDPLLTELRKDGWTLIGPRVRDQAIELGPINSAADLPQGLLDDQSPGRYRLTAGPDRAFFSSRSPANSPRQFVNVYDERFWQGRKDGTGWQSSDQPTQKIAFIGIHSCDLHAMQVQDRVLIEGSYVDANYAARRRDVFTVVLNCSEPAPTCFCESMGAGPAARSGFDLALTEQLSGDRHRFLITSGSSAGSAIMNRLPLTDPLPEDLALAGVRPGSFERTLDARAVRASLLENPDHPQWDDIAARCLGCGNCTMVCPTCFCSTVADGISWDGQSAWRDRRSDSCFTLDFSYIHGGSVRRSARSRFRQWMTHKLSAWYDQFGMPGCVGCGRCITWCPVGIDITAEAAAMLQPQTPAEPSYGKD